jgi:hypothetical protein
MKITIISKVFCAFALCASLTSFTSVNDKKSGCVSTVHETTMKASVHHFGTVGFKVKVSVDKGADQNLRIFLKDRGGKIYYSELFAKKEERYRRIFDLAEMNDGIYYFELYYNGQKIVKKIELETTRDRALSVL